MSYIKEWYKKKMKDPKWVAEKRRKGREYYHSISLKEHRKKWATPEFKERQSINRIKNKDKIKERVWATRGIIGITYRKYLALVKRQNNKCKICKTDMKKPCVDHDHKTGKFRGIICNKCNLHLGQYEENRKMFERYLK